jgi:sulfite reductase alpha subunit-like flavoprotein
VRHIELDLGESGLSYHAGDVAVVHPQNSALYVDDFIRSRGWHPSASIRLTRRRAAVLQEGTESGGQAPQLPAQCTVQELFAKYLDLLGTPRRYFFEQVL